MLSLFRSVRAGLIGGAFAFVLMCADAADTQTARLQAEIDSVSAAGGGRVMVGPGVHTVGTLWLKSNVELHLDEGAVLRASTDKADYNALDAFPENFSVPIENWVGRHLIVAHSVTNVALTGAGVVDGSGEDFLEERVWSVRVYGRRDKMKGDEPSSAPGRSGHWMHGIRWSRSWADPRPGQMVLFVKCRDVRVEGVALVNAPCWNLHVWGCERATVRDVAVRASRSAANADGIDIDCSTDVLVERCDIDAGDDGITFRGSEKRLGGRKPCERVTVRNCSVASCSAPFRFGVGTGLVRDILIENCRVWRGGEVLTYSCSYEGRGGCDIENVTVRNVVAEGCAAAGSYKNCPLGPANEFGVRNVVVENCDFAHSPADYGVVVDGRPVRLHKVRRLVRPSACPRQGVSRSYAQTEEAAFASVTSAGPVTFDVSLPGDKGPVSRYAVAGPGRHVFNPDGAHRPELTLIVNPPKKWDEKWTRTFGPGEHYVGTLRLRDGDRIFVDENAVLHGNIVGENVRDVKICGTGVIDTGCYERFDGSSAEKGVRSAANLAFFSCRDVTVDGLVLVDAAEGPVTSVGCERMTFENVKELGQWRCGGDLSPRTFCNPLPLPDLPRSVYEFGRTPHRQVSDPTLFRENATWYVYPSAGLVWSSADDGGTWKAEPNPDGLQGHGPTMVKHKGRYFYMPDTEGSVYEAKTPTGPWTRLGKIALPDGALDPADAMLFSDDDGRLYFYWGCSPTSGIWGCELDADDPCKVVSAPKKLIPFDPLRHPWERHPGFPDTGWLEGAWMMKVGKSYVLVYSAGGAENAAYAMGAYRSDSPLGEFRSQKNNPFFVNPSGFVTGTGHGSLVKDERGEWWISYCIMVGDLHRFERRIGLDRIEVGADGEICVAKATDEPQWLPKYGRGPTGWKKIPVETSAGAAADGLYQTHVWMFSLPATVEYAFRTPHVVRAFRLCWREGCYNPDKGINAGPVRYRVHVRALDGLWRVAFDASSNARDLVTDYRETEPIAATAARLEVLSAPKSLELGLTEWTVFGTETSAAKPCGELSSVR